MENYIAFITLSTGSKHKITQETYNQILEAEKDDFIVLPNGTTFKNSAVMEIDGIENWVDEKGFNYGQPYQALPAKGYDGIINSAPNRGLEAMARGLKKFIAKNPNSPKAKSLLDQMRKVYAKKNKQKQMA